MQRQVLPTDLQFSHYDLRLTPDLVNFTFRGAVHINFKLVRPTNKIVLNAKELQIETATVMLPTGEATEPATVTEITFDKENERVALVFDQDLVTDGIVTISFTGNLNDQMAGFYRCQYTGADGTPHFAAATQFEATDARRAFPCGDEPALKATFDVTLVVPKNLTALSNMEVLEESHSSRSADTDLKIVKFARTPVMSTYLLAFYVGEVDYVETWVKKPDSGQDLQVRVYTPLGKKEQGRFALEVAANMLTFYSEYFDIDFPLNKMDMIALQDFAAGAMENWGLVTYRSKYVLYDQQETSPSQKKAIAYVIGHELAHQWFGNLVTMDWWSDLWLNEGFATWVGWMATDHFFPEWKVWEHFIDREFMDALNLDKLDSSHPIENDVKNATQVEEIFDAITYSKGSCIIRMLANYLGPSVFQAGLRRYLKKHMWGNTTTNDLWESLAAVSGKDVQTMMNSWTSQKGYPIVTVELNKGTLTCTQQKYCACADSVKSATADVWTIPLNIINGSNDTIDRSEMSSKCYSTSSKGSNCDHYDHCDWIKLNTNQTGFYRTKYGPQLGSKLKTLVLNRQLNCIDRIDLIANKFAFAESGYGSIVDALDFLEAYENETEYQVWLEIVTFVSLVQSVWSGDAAVTDQIKFLGLQLIGKLVDDLGWEPAESETYQTGLLRKLVLTAAGVWGDQAVVAEAKRRVDLYLSGDQSVLSANLRDGAFRIFTRHGDEHDFDRLAKFYSGTDSDEVKSEVLRALGSVTDSLLFEKAFKFAFSSGHVRSQDAWVVVNSVLAQNAAHCWKLVESNWDRLCELYQDGSFLFGRVVAGGLRGLYDRAHLTAARKFLELKKDDTKSIQNTIEQAVEETSNRIGWLERDTAALGKWLESTF